MLNTKLAAWAGVLIWVFWVFALLLQGLNLLWKPGAVGGRVFSRKCLALGAGAV